MGIDLGEGSSIFESEKYHFFNTSSLHFPQTPGPEGTAAVASIHNYSKLSKKRLWDTLKVRNWRNPMVLL